MEPLALGIYFWAMMMIIVQIAMFFKLLDFEHVMQQGFTIQLNSFLIDLSR